ncbi:AraC family transcriptional regulator [Variovorax sp. 770b2]|uniref:AraC family transcriptional regulator n=1 Tax=Variovorax sp. 770b2 TaxID=1566271 RepID=UPI0008F1F267|nr:AraC family transcriptional regulator [Variovorax sp. 770b2]SFQ32873.1 AraC-type DNA-binding protein [Variovorax sp. 770b2]
MQSRNYRSDSLPEGNQILSSEWSRHRISVQHGHALRLRFSIRSITPSMSVSSLSYGAQAVVHPEERADVLLVQMPRSGFGRAQFDDASMPMDADNYALVHARSVAQVLYGREVDMLVLRIAMDRVNARLEEDLGRRLPKPLSFFRGMARGSQAWAAWAPVAATLAAVDASALRDFPAPAMAALEEMVLSTLLFAQPHSHSEALLRPRPAIAPRHVRRAEEFIHSNLHHATATAEIAAHAGVSTRALFDGFRRFRQTTPAAYVREARLAAARADLEGGRGNVREVAARWGFTHSGHFAVQYRRQYGEAPTHTLRSKLMDS